MKSIVRYTILAIVLLPLASVAQQIDNKQFAEKQLDQLLLAIADNDYEQFISYGDKRFEKIKESTFRIFESKFGIRIRSGYEAQYLTKLNKQTHKVYIWKITYAGFERETLANLIINDSEVAAFWLQ